MGAHGGSATEQEGLRQLQTSYLVLLAALHDGEPSHVRTARVRQYLDVSQVQLNYAVGAVFLGVF
ncbi:MAG: hypothetical protein ACK559_09835, partial [bacterium]